MPLPILKENATLEEKNEWIVKAQEEYKTIETDNETFKKLQETNEEKIKSLETSNQKLFLRVTSKVDTEQTEDKDVIPSYISKEVYEGLSDKEKQLLKEIDKGEDE